MKIKSQYYSVLFIFGIFILLISSVLMVTNWIISEHIEKQIESKINQFQFYVESMKNQAIENKINFCNMIANDKNLISAIGNMDSEAIHSIMQTTFDITDKYNLLMKDNDGNTLLKSGIFKKETSVGKISESEEYKISLLVIGNEHYLMFTVNVQESKKSIGRISIGYPFINIIRFENINEIQFAILNGKQILNSSFEAKQESIVEFLNVHKPIADAVLATSRPSDMFSTIFDGNEVYSKVLPFGSGVPVLLLVSVSKSNEFLFLDTLFEYLVYILIFFSLMLLIIFIVVVNRSAKKINQLNSKIKSQKEEPEIKSSEISKDKKGTISISKIICLDNTKKENDDSFINTLDIYQKIQTELIELYDGKVENIINNQMIASFMGNEDTIEKSIQCSQAIMKLLNKEAETTNCQIAIGLNYGTIFYSSGEKFELIGSTLEMTEAIIHVSKPGQILIPENLIPKTEKDYSNIESKVWKFKNFEDEVRLIDISNILK